MYSIGAPGGIVAAIMHSVQFCVHTLALGVVGLCYVWHLEKKAIASKGMLMM